MSSIILYRHTPPSEAIREFESALVSQRLSRASHELYSLGLDDEDMHQAVRRAMHACLALDWPIEQHFRCTFVCHQRAVVPSWKLSETAFRLVLLNANPSHPGVARFQLKLIGKSPRDTRTATL